MATKLSKSVFSACGLESEFREYQTWWREEFDKDFLQSDEYAYSFRKEVCDPKEAARIKQKLAEELAIPESRN